MRKDFGGKRHLVRLVRPLATWFVTRSSAYLKENRRHSGERACLYSDTPSERYNCARSRLRAGPVFSDDRRKLVGSRAVHDHRVGPVTELGADAVDALTRRPGG